MNLYPIIVEEKFQVDILTDFCATNMIEYTDNFNYDFSDVLPYDTVYKYIDEVLVYGHYKNIFTGDTEIKYNICNIYILINNQIEIGKNGYINFVFTFHDEENSHSYFLSEFTPERLYKLNK